MKKVIFLALLVFFFTEKSEAQRDSVLWTDSLPISIHTAALSEQALPIARKSDQLNLATQLNQIPGVQMQSGALNTNRIVVRGIGSRSPFTTSKIRAYLDEIPLTNGAGESSLEDIDLIFFENIKLRKGPSSSLYGAGLGGVLQLQTPRFSANQRDFSSTVGSYGLFRQTALISQGNEAKKRFFRLGYSFTKQDGYRENSNYQRHGLMLNGRIGQIGYLFNFIDLKSQIPSSLSATDFEENPRQAAVNWASVMGFEDYQKLQFGISHRAVLGKDSDWSLASSVFAVYRPSYESRPFNILKENSLYGGLRSRILHEKRRENGQKWLFSGGFEVFGEKYVWATFETNGGAQGSILTENREFRSYWNTFAEAEFSSKKHHFLLGLNLNQTLYDIEDQNSDFQTEHQFSPIVSPLMQYRFEASPKWTLEASLGHGFSPPNTEETQGADGRFNDQIHPEQGWQLELGFDYGTPENEPHLEANIYTIFVRDLLVSRRNAVDLWEGVNAGKTRHSGLELEAGFPKKIGKTKLLLSANYALNLYQFTEFIDRGNDLSGNPLTGVPKYQGGASLTVTFPRQIELFVNTLAVGTMPLRDDNSLSSEAYSVTNVQVSKAFFLKKMEFSLDVGLQNAFTAHYARMVQINASAFGGALPRYYYPGAKRNGYVRVSMRF